MPQSEFSQHKELLVKDLSIDHQLKVVLLDHVFDPFGNDRLDSAVVNLLELFLSHISGLLNNLADIILRLPLVDEHVCRLAICIAVGHRLARDITLILGQVVATTEGIIWKRVHTIAHDRFIIELFPVIVDRATPFSFVFARFRLLLSTLCVDIRPVMAMSACSTVDVDTNKPVLEVLTLHLL